MAIATTATTAVRAAEALLRQIKANEAMSPKDDNRNLPGLCASRCPHVRQDIMERIEPDDYGWVIPLQVAGEWAVLTYHLREGWEVHDGGIPDWIAVQLVDTIQLADREPGDESLSHNGGDYEESRILHREGELFRVEYRSSYDGDFCSRCGSYQNASTCGCATETMTCAEVWRIVDARSQAEAVCMLGSDWFYVHVVPEE